MAQLTLESQVSELGLEPDSELSSLKNVDAIINRAFSRVITALGVPSDDKEAFFNDRTDSWNVGYDTAPEGLQIIFDQYQVYERIKRLLGEFNLSRYIPTDNSLGSFGNEGLPEEVHQEYLHEKAKSLYLSWRLFYNDGGGVKHNEKLPYTLDREKHSSSLDFAKKVVTLRSTLPFVREKEAVRKRDSSRKV